MGGDDRMDRRRAAVRLLAERMKQGVLAASAEVVVQYGAEGAQAAEDMVDVADDILRTHADQTHEGPAG